MFYHFAPVQGHTDAPYRHFHADMYGAETYYYTPFIRLERGELRTKDIKDTTSGLNANLNLIPQIIFRDSMELDALINLMKEQGASEINLNMGCPFPLQTGHGRGAATVANHELAEYVAETINRNVNIGFSVKIRLGMTDPEEWKILLTQLNKAQVRYVAVHPRVARQQYGGDLHMDQFKEIVEFSRNPVVFNGEIHTPEDIDRILREFPSIGGIMIGRGLLSRPSLVKEYLSGEEWDKVKRIEMMLRFHRNLYDHYSSTLCGDNQILSKIKPFWEYAESEIGRKAWKAIRKASNIARYNSAVALINDQL